MTELDELLSKAYASEGKQDDVNKVYLTLLRTNLFLPVKKNAAPVSENDEPFIPLHAKIDNQYYMLVFDTQERLSNWAGDQREQVDFVEISGKDVITGINEQVFLCLNHGTDFYKEFTPDEVKRLKMIVARIEQMKAN